MWTLWGLPGEGLGVLTTGGIQPSRGSGKNGPGAGAKAPRQECGSTGSPWGLAAEAECQDSVGPMASLPPPPCPRRDGPFHSLRLLLEQVQSLALGRSPFLPASLGKGR